jgi:hypothetical protein
MVYSGKLKMYYVYKEFDDEFGFKERIYITTVFENVEELFDYMNERKEYYKGNTRKIEIEIIHSKGE